jgi:hypothetical protein
MWKIILVMVVLLMMVAIPCQAQWDDSDSGLIILRLVNYQLTRETYQPETVIIYVDGFPVELIRTENQAVNPLLGESPTFDKIDSLYGVLLIGDLIILNQEKYPNLKKWWKFAGYTLETYALTQNLSIKYGWSF